MIIIVAVLALLGGVLGALTARRRKGRTADILQYAAVYALIFALVGVFGTIIIHRVLT